MNWLDFDQIFNVFAGHNCQIQVIVHMKCKISWGPSVFSENTVHVLIHFILNKLSHTIYWKSPISVLGMSGYEIYIFREKKS